MISIAFLFLLSYYLIMNPASVSVRQSGQDYMHQLLIVNQPKLYTDNNVYGLCTTEEEKTVIQKFNGVDVTFNISYGTVLNKGQLGKLFHDQGRARVIAPDSFEIPTMHALQITSSLDLEQFLLGNDSDRYTKFCYAKLMNEVARDFLAERNLHLTNLIQSAPVFIGLADPRYRNA